MRCHAPKDNISGLIKAGSLRQQEIQMNRSIFVLRHLHTASMLLLLASNLQPAAAAAGVEPGDVSRPKIGLALSGGGARGSGFPSRRGSGAPSAGTSGCSGTSTTSRSGSPGCCSTSRRASWRGAALPGGPPGPQIPCSPNDPWITYLFSRTLLVA